MVKKILALGNVCLTILLGAITLAASLGVIMLITHYPVLLWVPITIGFGLSCYGLGHLTRYWISLITRGEESTSEIP